MKKAETVPVTREEFQKWRRAYLKGTGDRAELFKKIAEALVPGWFEFHSWTNRIIEACCNHRWICLSGCSNSAKTRNIAGFAVTWWLMAPAESSVLFCSTTSKMLRKRGWAEVQNYFQAVGGDFGNFVDSRMIWQYEQGDDKHAIFGKAVAEGDVNKSAVDLQGLHTKRQMIVIDEGEGVPGSIWKVAANHYGYCIDSGGEFLFVAAANPRSRLSQFGRFMEPEGGWNSVSVDTEEWVGKPQLDGNPTAIVRFDFRKSPNILEGRVVSKHIPTKQRVDQRMRSLEAKHGENDPDHWCYDLGFPAPEGLSKTVFSESEFETFGAYGKHDFVGTNFLIIGVIDPAYGGGDRAVIRFGALGDIAVHKKGIEWCGDPIECFLDATSTRPPKYQLLDQIKKWCGSVMYRGKEYVCEPQNFGIDCTGDAGLYEIAQIEWSTKVIGINFSESPSEEPCSYEDERPAKEVYLNKRVEMYWRTHSALLASQIRGVDQDSASELCTIEELIERTDGTVRPKKSLQSKKQYKLKFQKSPDLADAAVMLTEVARKRGFSIAAVGLTTQRYEELDKRAKEVLEIYDEDSMFQPENEFEEV